MTLLCRPVQTSQGCRIQVEMEFVRQILEAFVEFAVAIIPARPGVVPGRVIAAAYF